MAELFACDRATAYHAIYTFDEQLKLRNTDYVQAVERWIPIVNEFEDNMKSVAVDVRRTTTEELIYSMLASKYDELEAMDILSNLKERFNDKRRA